MKTIGTILMTCFIVMIVSFVFAGIATWLWGLIITPVFGAPVITYWQMYGIRILLNILLPNHNSLSSN